MLDNLGRQVIVPEEVPEDWATGWNKDKKKCKKCQFRGLQSKKEKHVKNGCDYIEIVKHSRGCKIEDCFRYVKGKRIKINTHAGNNEEEEYAD